MSERERVGEVDSGIPGPAAMPQPEAPSRRRRLPWVLLSIGGAALLVAGIVVAFVVIPSFVGGTTDPAATVRDFDQAYRDVDCELYQSVTSESFRQTSQGVDASGAFDCATWADFASGYTVGGEYQYRIEVISSALEGEEAIVRTHEVDLGTHEEFDYDYTLMMDVDGGWVISSIFASAPGSE